MNSTSPNQNPLDIKNSLAHPPAKAARIASAIISAVAEFELRTRRANPSTPVTPFSVLFYEIDSSQVLFSLICEQIPVANCSYTPASSKHTASGLMLCDADGKRVPESCSLTRTLQPLIEQAILNLETQVLSRSTNEGGPWAECWPVAPPSFEATTLH